MSRSIYSIVSVVLDNRPIQILKSSWSMMDQRIVQEKFATSMLRKMTVFECSIFKTEDCLMLEIQEWKLRQLTGLSSLIQMIIMTLEQSNIWLA